MVPEQDQRRDTGLSGLPSHFRAGQARTSDVPLHVLVSPHRLHPIKPEPVQRAGSTVSVDGHKWTHSSDDDSIAQAPTADQHPLHAKMKRGKPTRQKHGDVDRIAEAKTGHGPRRTFKRLDCRDCDCAMTTSHAIRYRPKA
eukprot:CAMPEP_0198123156 /NCGR_PEP_ID=MMETSP1442-20131203/36814_1 /TAXON_ID= /ORGANISM="Craspedostauros australis, Strain CCMP3328" /LENGTH=140 /DNA_ID=CAMNT_0043782315 /DNA_START=313 /DNA_END=732 /DNA_ORIENTATION=-